MFRRDRLTRKCELRTGFCNDVGAVPERFCNHLDYQGHTNRRDEQLPAPCRTAELQKMLKKYVYLCLHAELQNSCFQCSSRARALSLCALVLLAVLRCVFFRSSPFAPFRILRSDCCMFAGHWPGCQWDFPRFYLLLTACSLLLRCRRSLDR
jgi:hypothetical protein